MLKRGFELREAGCFKGGGGFEASVVQHGGEVRKFGINQVDWNKKGY